MRLDKFLKVSRVIKRRAVANEACDGGRVRCNGRVAKAGTQIAINDKIEIAFGDKTFAFVVKDIRDTNKKEDAQSMYEIIVPLEEVTN